VIGLLSDNWEISLRGGKDVVLDGCLKDEKDAMLCSFHGDAWNAVIGEGVRNSKLRLGTF